MKKLYLAEKKDIGLAIAEHLWSDKSYICMPQGKNQSSCQYVEKDGVVVSWARGHLLQYMPPDAYDPKFKSWNVYPVFPENFTPRPIKESIAQFNVVSGLIAKAEEVIHAGDPDREGQLLIDEILTYCRYKGPVKRLLINAKDELSLKRAFDSMKDNREFRSLYAAGVARAQYDWFVGYNLTRAYSKAAEKVGYTESWSIGRVRTPTLALVVRREQEIAKFKKQDYYGLKAVFSYKDKTFAAQWKPPENLLDAEGRLLDKAAAEKLLPVLKKAQGVVKDIKTDNVSIQPPLPYSLDTLQIEADKVHKIAPNEVLEIAEELYLSKLTSYPRSDCNHLPTSQLEDAERILGALSNYGLRGAAEADTAIVSKAWNDKKVSAHHAIIPTGILPSKALSEKAAIIYRMICLRYICQFHPPCEFLKTSFTLDLQGEVFAGSGRVITKLGFKALATSEEANLEDNKEDSKNEEAENLELPKLTKGETIGLPSKLDLVKKVTSPPKRFTQGTLLKAMTDIYRFMAPDNPNREKLKEVKGIGTPATRHVIIEELLAKTRNSRKVTPFLTTNKKNELVPTDFAKAVMENVDDYLKLPDHTALMEFRLKEILDGKLSFETYISEAKASIIDSISYTQTHKFTLMSSTPVYTCPICMKSPLIQRYSPKNKAYFWVCIDEGCTNPVTEKKVYYEDKSGEPSINLCPYCSNLLSLRKGSFGAFWSCMADKKHILNDLDGKPVIAYCDVDHTILKQHKGSFGLFWSCPTCKKTFKDNGGLPSLNITEEAFTRTKTRKKR